MSSASPPMPAPYTSPPITIVLAVIILVFFCFGFFSIYFCRCVVGSIVRIQHFRRSPSGDLVSVACATTHQGLEPSHIETFPAFKYSSVKDFRREEYGLECAICLCEFENESMLRLLTVCDHVFHQECIDLWLESHKTCPVCRRILDPADESFGKASPASGIEIASTRDLDLGNEPEQDAIAIDVRVDGDDGNDHDHDHEGRDEEEGEGSGGRRKGLEREQEASPSGVDKDEISKGKLSRSNTTGHSIVRNREEEDRYTLRLPDHVRNRLLRGHNWTGSCTTFGDISKNKASGRYGESGFSGGDKDRSRAT